MVVFGKLLDWVGLVCDLFIYCVVVFGNRVDDLFVDDSKLMEFVGNFVSGVWYVLGICKMGVVVDLMLVMDGVGCVYGIVGLCVCDLLIMFFIFCVNMNLLIFMFVEWFVDVIKFDLVRVCIGILVVVKL